MGGGADWGVATISFCILTYACFHEYHLARMMTDDIVGGFLVGNAASAAA